jgi:mono/diheme cytochrome c family protein
MRLPSALSSPALPRVASASLRGKLAVLIVGAALFSACQEGGHVTIKLPANQLPMRLTSAPNVPGDPENGRKLFTDSKFYPPNGCGSCHTVGGVSSGTLLAAPNLTNMSLRPTLAGDSLPNSPAQMKAWIMDPPAMKRDSRMPKMNVSDQEAQDLTAFIYSLPYNPVQ